MTEKLHRCAIKDCNKVGKYRLILPSSDEHYGWFCGIHQSELYYDNYLEGEDYALTMGRVYSMITCKICDNGTPCGKCRYEKVDDMRWSYIGSEYERAGIKTSIKLGNNVMTVPDREQ